MNSKVGYIQPWIVRLDIYNLPFVVAKHKSKYESTKKMKERDGREERECTDRIIYIILLGWM